MGVNQNELKQVLAIIKLTKQEQENNQIRAQEGGKHRTWEHWSDSYSPLPNGASRAVHHPTGRGGGRSGGLKGHGDRTGQEASRAVPVPGPTVQLRYDTNTNILNLTVMFTLCGF